MSELNQNTAYARLFYLSLVLKLPIPRATANLLPGAALINSVKSLAAPELDSDAVNELWERGAAVHGEPTPQEWRELVLRLLETQNLRAQDWINVLGELGSIDKGRLLQETIIPFAELASTPAAFPRWSTGLIPFDHATGGGLTPGIYTFIGAPGAGKSSLMLMLAESLVRVLPKEKRLTVVQTEMPLGVYHYRMSPILGRTNFRANDMLVCAPWGPSELINYLEGVNDKNHVVIYDSPDPILLSQGGDGVRHAIASAWMDFIRIKNALAETIIVTSWSKRGEKANLTMESGAEGAAKERGSDVVIGFNQVNDNTVRFETYKNRLGSLAPPLNVVINWQDLTFSGNLGWEGGY